MKKYKILFIFIFCLQSCALAKSTFVYHIPEENSPQPVVEEIQPAIISDDVTADTSGISEEDLHIEDEFSDSEEENYQISDMYSDVLKGYAKYNEEDANSIYLEDFFNNYYKINLPSKFSTSSDIQLSKNSYFNYPSKATTSKFGTEEYSITPLEKSTSKSIGGFSTGTTYSQEISYGELEKTSGVFSRYQYRNFAISTSFKKTVNTTNNNYNDNLYITPELKLNQYLTLKESFSTDFIKKRNKAELILSINPFGKKDTDRLQFDFGASRTYNQTDETFKSQIKFETKFRL